MPSKVSTLAILSFIFSIIGLIVFPFGIAGIVFAVYAKKEIARNSNISGRGFANAGLIIGIISILLFIFYLVFLFYIQKTRVEIDEKIKSITDTESTEKICAVDVNLEIIEIAGRPRLFYKTSTGELSFLLQNDGKETIEAVRISVIKSDGSLFEEDLSDTRIEPGMIINRNISLPKVNISQVRFIPYILEESSNEKILCIRSSLIKTDINIVE